MPLIQTFKICIAVCIVFHKYTTVNCFPFLCDKNQNKIKALPTIIDGKVSVDDAHPYMVGFRTVYPGNVVGGVWCGGSIVSNFLVLTAAHCVAGLDKKEYALCVHCQNSLTNFFLVRVSSVLVHPDFNPTFLTDDIAIVIVTAALTHFTVNIFPLCILENTAKATNEALFVGWGSDKGSVDPSLNLKEVETVLDPNLCSYLKHDMRLQGILYDEEKMLCYNNLDKGPGFGDSGGPILTTFHGSFAQVGVISSTIFYSNRSLTIGMNMRSYAPWLRQVFQRYS